MYREWEWEAHKSCGKEGENSGRQIEGKRKGTAETFEGWGKLLANVRAESSGTATRRMERSAWRCDAMRKVGGNGWR